MITCTIAIIAGIIRWRNPSGGYVFTSLFTVPASRMLGIKIDVKNFERLDANQPCVYVGNHQSNMDMLIQAKCFRPRTVCIGKKELIWIPFFGALFYLTGHILLDRKNHEKALAGLNEAKDVLVRRKISIYMFPEGTRNKTPEKLLPFKKGAFHLAIAAQVPILPVVCCPVKPLINIQARKITPGIARIEVLEPIPTIGLTNSDVDALVATAYERMQKAYEELSR
jgi:1-acyl-sn-glycerol-3-phosphate acyltransferase